MAGIDTPEPVITERRCKVHQVRIVDIVCAIGQVEYPASIQMWEICPSQELIPCRFGVVKIPLPECNNLEATKITSGVETFIIFGKQLRPVRVGLVHTTITTNIDWPGCLLELQFVAIRQGNFISLDHSKNVTRKEKDCDGRHCQWTTITID